MGKSLSFFISCTLIIFVSFFLYAFYYFNAPNKLSDVVDVTIKKGSSLSTITSALYDVGVIDQPLLFRIAVRVIRGAGRLQAGNYQFPPHATPANVFNKLVTGDVTIYQVTIPEGLMSSQIVELINQTSHLEGEVSQDIAEGTLLPETYYFHAGDGRGELIERMQEAMEETKDLLWETRPEDFVLETQEEWITLASIVEKETSLPSERGMVAAVFLNRLKKGMRLQTDPTVIYAITKGAYVLERALRYKDLLKDDPYNTYKIDGLPPGPIANPGKEALKAVLFPADTKALYFVADGTGGHQFSTTYAEHQNHVKAWRKFNKTKVRDAALKESKNNAEKEVILPALQHK